MRKIEYVISIQGQQAVSAGYALQQGKCYKVIKDNDNRFIDQENREDIRPDGKPDDGTLCCLII